MLGFAVLEAISPFSAFRQSFGLKQHFMKPYKIIWSSYHLTTMSKRCIFARFSSMHSRYTAYQKKGIQFTIALYWPDFQGFLKFALKSYKFLLTPFESKLDDSFKRNRLLKYTFKIRMVQVSRFFVTKILPKSLWESKSFQNSYQSV